MINEKEFYKNKFTSPHSWRWYFCFFEPFHLGLYKLYWLKRSLKKGSKILDLGCGGGWEYLGKNYETTGVDISEEAVEQAKKIYPNALVADLKELPFPDNTFDSVISLDIFGHILKENKDQVLSEIKRVLKPNGITVHYIETTRENNDLQKMFPDLYYKYFILEDGHFGLETPKETINRFSRQFQIIKTEGHAAIFSPIDDFNKRFNNEMEKASLKIFILVKLARFLKNRPYLRFLANCCLGILAKITNPFADINNSSGLFISAKKPPE